MSLELALLARQLMRHDKRDHKPEAGVPLLGTEVTQSTQAWQRGIRNVREDVRKEHFVEEVSRKRASSRNSEHEVNHLIFNVDRYGVCQLLSRTIIISFTHTFRRSKQAC